MPHQISLPTGVHLATLECEEAYEDDGAFEDNEGTSTFAPAPARRPTAAPAMGNRGLEAQRMQMQQVRRKLNIICS